MDIDHHDGGDLRSLERELITMAARLDGLRSQESVSAAEVAAELETAMEELRVTAEEVDVQQRHIMALLHDSEQSRAMMERLVDAVPTPVLTTDPQGSLLHVNDPATRLLGVPVDRLLGKPLQAFVDVADRRTVRTMVAAAAEGEVPEAATVALTPRGDGRHRAVLIAMPGAGEAAGRQVRWFVDPTPPTEGREGSLALLGAFGELVALPMDDTSLPAVLRQVVGVAKRALPEADDVTITIGDPRHPDLLSSGSPMAQQVDAAQLTVGEGPCVDAFLTDRLTGSDDVSADRRWPELARRLQGADVSAALGVPLHGDGGVLGVLNLYGRAGVRLNDPGARANAELFGRAASALVQDSRRLQVLQDEAYHLRRALMSRPEIDQAKGILMARFGYSADDAFQHLVAVSQKRNVKLREVARQIVEMVQRQATRPEEAAAPPS